MKVLLFILLSESFKLSKYAKNIKLINLFYEIFIYLFSFTYYQIYLHIASYMKVACFFIIVILNNYLTLYLF